MNGAVKKKLFFLKVLNTLLVFMNFVFFILYLEE